MLLLALALYSVALLTSLMVCRLTSNTTDRIAIRHRCNGVCTISVDTGMPALKLERLFRVGQQTGRHRSYWMSIRRSSGCRGRVILLLLLLLPLVVVFCVAVAHHRVATKHFGMRSETVVRSVQKLMPEARSCVVATNKSFDFFVFFFLIRNVSHIARLLTLFSSFGRSSSKKAKGQSFEIG